MIPEPFAQGNSLIHAINPQLKAALALTYSLVLAFSSSIIILMVGLITALCLVLLARLPIKDVLKRLSVLIGFLVLIWLLMPLTYPGTAIIKFGIIKLSTPGLLLALQISLKSTAILMTMMALLTTMPVAALGHALRNLGLPTKLVYLLLITYRYLFVFEQAYQRLIRAARIRGFTPGTNLHSYRTYAYLAGMLLVHAWSRANRVSNAMKCRGFSGKFYALNQFEPDSRNWPFGLIMSIIILTLATMEIWIRITLS
jgi:cobalt/nickel transport system permease protein